MVDNPLMVALAAGSPQVVVVRRMEAAGVVDMRIAGSGLDIAGSAVLETLMIQAALRSHDGL